MDHCIHCGFDWDPDYYCQHSPCPNCKNEHPDKLRYVVIEYEEWGETIDSRVIYAASIEELLAKMPFPGECLDTEWATIFHPYKDIPVEYGFNKRKNEWTNEDGTERYPGYKEEVVDL